MLHWCLRERRTTATKPIHGPFILDGLWSPKGNFRQENRYNNKSREGAGVVEGGEPHFPSMHFSAHDPGVGFTSGIAVITNDKYASTGAQLFLVPHTTILYYCSHQHAGKLLFSSFNSPNHRAHHRLPLHDSGHSIVPQLPRFYRNNTVMGNEFSLPQRYRR